MGLASFLTAVTIRLEKTTKEGNILAHSFSSKIVFLLTPFSQQIRVVEAENKNGGLREKEELVVSWDSRI